MTVMVPFKATPHEILGGGYWAEVEGLPGCIAQAETLEELEANIAQAVIDWLQEVPEKTEDDARQFAKLQGRDDALGGPYPEPNPYLPPSGWSEDDE